MRNKVFDDLLHAKDFQQKVEIRDEVKETVTLLLEDWDGKYTKLAIDSLHQSIEMADEAGRNEIFGWYINYVSPIIRNWCKEESKNSTYVLDDANVMPITKFLLDFFEKFYLCHADDPFDFTHWEYALEWFRSNIGQMAPLEKSGAAYFPNIPYSKKELEKFEAEGKEPPEKAKLTFEQVLAMLEEAKFSADEDEKLKEKWAMSFHADFLQWFRLSAPTAYRYRADKWLLSLTLKMQKHCNSTFNKITMNIAHYTVQFCD